MSHSERFLFLRASVGAGVVVVLMLLAFWIILYFKDLTHENRRQKDDISA